MTLFSRRGVLGLAVIGSFAAMAGARAFGLDVIAYTPQTLNDAQATGKPYLLDFFATWCTTCKAQEQVLEQLRQPNTPYAAIPIVRVDWDENEKGDLVRQMGIPRRSTLVLMQGTTELGRVVAETSKDAIAGLLDKAAV